MWNATTLIKYLSDSGFTFYDDTKDTYIKKLNINGSIISFNTLNNSFHPHDVACQHGRIFDLTKAENHSVVMLLIKLFQKGYSSKVITLEKQWQLGHNDSGYLDVMLSNPHDGSIFMIEVKSYDEIYSYVNLSNENKTKQVFSYAIQEKSTKIISFYAHDFNTKADHFFNVYTEDFLSLSQNVDDFYERWNKVFDKSDYISENTIFNFSQRVKKYSDLEPISSDVTKKLFSQFLTILRLNSISDKPNAFMKMINLFLTKIADEISEDKNFTIVDEYNSKHKFKGMKFQFIQGIDTPESFLKRLNELYKIGMKEYLNKEVIDYSDEEIERLLNENNHGKLFEVFDDLRLKKNTNFTFIEVYDDDTFYENFNVVKDVVKLLESYKFKYESKQQFLGDFFEDLLNTSLKQEAGQFFTPYPLVDFIVDSLPYKNFILEKIRKGTLNFVPSVIDYACGAGHFLISSMEKTQNILNEIHLSEINISTNIQRKLDNFIKNPYSWVSRDNVIGIEKDYRLAKTTKISTFLNGDGDAEIISGDGINRFSAKEFVGTFLASNQNEINKLDFIVSNPPFSVDGFMLNFVKNNITPESNVFTLLNEINYKDTRIEMYFIERANQLLKNNGKIGVILPQSVLSGNKYDKLREYILSNFRIYAMMLSSDITFSGTTTSPVVLFMEKSKVKLDYDIITIFSPKYFEPKGGKKTAEVNFLGYEFSQNRNKSGINIKSNYILKKISPLIQDYILNSNVHVSPELEEYVKIKNIKDILLNKTNEYFGDIYPKYNKTPGKALSEYCLINTWKDEDFTDLPNRYVEISNIKNNSIIGPFKRKTTTRYCKKGDILFSSLNPSKGKIIIADGEYMLSTAIHVLSFIDMKIRDKVFAEIRKNEILNNISYLLDGFKVTYSKINEYNLYNNVLINI